MDTRMDLVSLEVRFGMPYAAYDMQLSIDNFKQLIDESYMKYHRI